jgi:hypothetical protein
MIPRGLFTQYLNSRLLRRVNRLLIGNATGGDPGAGGINATLIQVNGTSIANNIVQATKTDTFTTASGTFTDLTGVTVNITPRTTAKRVLVTVSLSVIGGVNTNGFEIKLVRGSTDIFVGDAASARSRASIGAVGGITTAQSMGLSFSYIDSPATTSATTYKIQVRAPLGDTLYVNRTITDTDSANFGRYASSIIVQEID